MLWTLSLFTLGLIASCVSGYADPGACSGSCQVHDPSLVQRQSDSVYFRFSTGGGIAYASATSLAGPWTNLGYVLPQGSKINLSGNTDLWAPDAHYVNGLYYVYYAVSTFSTQNSAIGLATSPTMEPGSWTDHGSVGVASGSKPYNAIDPNFFQDGGTNYLNFGSFWQDLYQVTMNSAATSASSSAHNLAYDPSGTHAEEGSFMYKVGSYYYLFWSAGICCGYTTSKPAAGQEYHIKVCRSTSPTSGFVDKSGVACTNGGGTLVLASHDYVYGPGGQGIFNDPHYGLVLYYHYINTNIGYGDDQTQWGWNQVSFSSGWPVV